MPIRQVYPTCVRPAYEKFVETYEKYFDPYEPTLYKPKDGTNIPEIINWLKLDDTCMIICGTPLNFSYSKNDVDNDQQLTFIYMACKQAYNIVKKILLTKR